MKKKKLSTLDKLSQTLTYYIGTNASILVHTILFVAIFSLRIFGTSIEEILLILTTAVSLEAIYLAIFIQMSVNRTTESLAGVEEDIDDIQEDIDDIQEDVDEIQEDVDDIQENVGEDSTEDEDVVKILKTMEAKLSELQRDISALQKKKV